MRVCIDISQIAHKGGVGVYTNQLAQSLVKQKDIDFIFFYSSLRKGYKGSLPNVKKFFIPPTLLEIFFNRLRFPKIESFIGKVDVFHSSDWTQPPADAKKVTTYHDVIPLKFPQWSHPKIVDVQKKRLKIVEKEIDMVIVVSESTKKDLLEVSKIPEEKVTVIYEGVDEQFKLQSKDEIESFKKRYGLPENFVLAISGIGERRNLERVKQAAFGFNLVIAGETLPQIPYNELPFLYASAKVLLYPSLYEGFGLPILEAQACGIPVITSNVSSMPEVGGKAAYYVNPKNIEEIRKGLKEVMENEKLRSELVRLGLENVKNFSWEKCAEETKAVYRYLSSRKPT